MGEHLTNESNCMNENEQISQISEKNRNIWKNGDMTTVGAVISNMMPLLFSVVVVVVAAAAI